jgi:hypothetical protein
MDKLRKNNYNFYESDIEVYQESQLKRIISRFELILNQYLRDFVSLSINDFVDFIKQFTDPKESEGELWKVSTVPLLVIHLSQKEKSKKKDEKKVDKKKKEGEEEAAQPADDDHNRVVLSPSIDECKKFILKSMKMITEST